jgi:hypothetical protein
MSATTKTTGSKHTDGTIFLEIPHQGTVNAYGFAGQSEFGEWLAKCFRNKPGASWCEYSLDEWRDYLSERDCDADVAAAMDAEAQSIFAAGATSVVTRCAGEMDDEEIIDPRGTSFETFALDTLFGDRHAYRILTRDLAIRALASEKDIIPHHQYHASRRAIELCANELDWIDIPDSDEE